MMKTDENLKDFFIQAVNHIRQTPYPSSDRGVSDGYVGANGYVLLSNTFNNPASYCIEYKVCSYAASFVCRRPIPCLPLASAGSYGPG